MGELFLKIAVGGDGLRRGQLRRAGCKDTLFFFFFFEPLTLANCYITFSVLE